MGADNLINIFLKFGKLKNVPRTGWLLRGVKRQFVESVAEHVARTAFISMVLSDKLTNKGIKLDRYKVVEMALLHDISEAMLLDIDKEVASIVGKDFKEKAERRIENFILKEIDPNLGKMYLDLLSEYHDVDCVEAEIVKISDKLETLVQASEYDMIGIPKRALSDFWDEEKSFIKAIKNNSVKKLVIEIVQEIRTQRKN